MSEAAFCNCKGTVVKCNNAILREEDLPASSYMQKATLALSILRNLSVWESMLNSENAAELDKAVVIIEQWIDRRRFDWNEIERLLDLIVESNLKNSTT